MTAISALLLTPVRGKLTGPMASAWRAEYTFCRWLGFADERKDIDRMVSEHAGDSKKNHVVTTEPGPHEPRR